MTDLIWIGNAIYPRWVVFVAIGVVLLVGFGIVAIVTKVAQKLICKWFGHRWMTGAWLRSPSEPVKYRTDICSCCGKRANWHCLAPRSEYGK